MREVEINLNPARKRTDFQPSNYLDGVLERPHDTRSWLAVSVLAGSWILPARLVSAVNVIVMY
jgi:hypothetical protein